MKQTIRAFAIGMAAITTLSMLAACSSAPANTNTKSEPDEITTATVQPTIEPITPAPSPEPTAAAPPAELVKLYKMNKAYRFVPINDNTAKDMVLLTFDDGPHNKDVLTSLLDTLDKHNAKAIFFVNGYRVKQHPELLKLIHDRGQTIGNHSWDHINLKEESSDKIEQQINDVQQDVKALIDEAPVFFRPPYGSGGDKVKEIAKNHGMLFMTWSNGSLDWEQKAPGKPDEVINNVLEQLHPGANILMHELSWTAEALDGLLGKLEEKGYGFIDPATIALTPST